MALDSPGVCGLFFYFKSKWQGMAFATPYFRFRNIPLGFFAKCTYLYTALKDSRYWPSYLYL